MKCLHMRDLSCDAFSRRRVYSWKAQDIVGWSAESTSDSCAVATLLFSMYTPIVAFAFVCAAFALK
jgi:hypothetical protein